MVVVGVEEFDVDYVGELGQWMLVVVVVFGEGLYKICVVKIIEYFWVFGDVCWVVEVYFVVIIGWLVESE